MTAGNQPLELGLAVLGREHIVGNDEHRFITSDFGFVNSMVNLQSSIFHIGQPYRIMEGRILLPLCGKVRISINLIEYTIYPGDVMLISPGSIAQILEMTADFDVRMVAPANTFMELTCKNDFFSRYLSGQLNVLLKASDEDRKVIDNFFSLIWDLLQNSTYQKEVIQHLVTALFHHIEYIWKRTQTFAQSPSRQEDLFQRFIVLVNANCKEERNVGFYADKLCLTPRYLNTIIKQISQQTVMDWINQAIILEAKVLLKHSDLLVYQVSDKLNFPNPSFFCKFFKRITGMTPQAYQNE